MELDFLFIDDNRETASTRALEKFSQSNPGTVVYGGCNPGDYVCNETMHHWTPDLMRKVGAFKDRIIAAALEGNYDYLFLVDSDLVLPPQLLTHLISLDKPVVSEVFWTSWEPDGPALPQVWLSDRYTLHERRADETLTKEEIGQRTMDFLRMLRRPGTYRVGGLGACTLIKREALQKGLHFGEIDNVSFLGEDRHFCIRARALGVELWADTRYPPLHLYRESDLARVEAFRARWAADFLANPKLTLSMVVKNEAGRHLEEALRAHRSFIHEAVIVDDGSTDGTAELVARELEGIPLRLVRNPTSKFANEIELRKQQWEETLATNPDWILNLDADEILEPRAAEVIPEILRQEGCYAVGFRLYDFWSDTHYREDRLWNAHECFRPLLIRYAPDFRYRWLETPQHCGRMPMNVLELPAATTDLRVKHMGWSRPEERERKLARYRQLDPEARFGSEEQYTSILDPAPNLVAWME